MRVLIVILSSLAAILLGLWSYGAGSVPGAAAAIVFAIIAAAATAGVGSRRRAAAPASVLAVPSAPMERALVVPVAPVDLAQPDLAPVETGAAMATDADHVGDGPVPERDEAVAEPHISPDMPDPTAFEESAPSVTPSPLAEAMLSDPVRAAGEPVAMEPDGDPAAPASCATRDMPKVRTPFSVQPTVVLMSFYDAAAAWYDTLAAHLWLHDVSTDTLRLIAAFGPQVPEGGPVPLTTPVLGEAASSGNAVFASLHTPAAHDDSAVVWRYAVPVGTPEMRGVAAVDLATRESSVDPDVLNEVSAILRGSLTAALAIHVAHSEMETAVQLLSAAQELAAGIGREELIAKALDRAMRVADASTGSVMLPDPATGALRIVASRGLPKDVVANTQVAEGEGIAGVVFASASPMLVEDLPGEPGARRHGVMSSASVPIADETGTMGVINVGSRAFPARLTDAYLSALEILGTQTAVALRTADEAERSWDRYLDNLEALATALEANDPFRKGSSKRTANLAVALGRELELEADELVSLRIAAILHDVGMGLATGSVGATDRPLTTVDRGLVQAHPKVASDVMASVPSLEHLAPMVRHHHERFDGTGYDTGLSGDAIPVGSRILAVVDAFVSMTSQRPYREALPPTAALDELVAMAGTQFDPAVVHAFRVLIAADPGLAD